MASSPLNYLRWLAAVEDSIYKIVTDTSNPNSQCSRLPFTTLSARRSNLQLQVSDEKARKKTLLNLYATHGPIWFDSYAKDLDGNIWLFVMKDTELEFRPVGAYILWIDKNEGERWMNQKNADAYVVVKKRTVITKPLATNDALGDSDWVDVAKDIAQPDLVVTAKPLTTNDTLGDSGWVGIAKDIGQPDFVDDWQLVNA